MKRPALAATIPWAIWVSSDRNKLPGAIRGRHGRSLRNWLRRGRNRNCPETHCPSKSERKVVGSSHHNDARKHEDRAVGQISKLAWKVRSHCRSPKTRLARIIDQHLGGPCLELSSCNGLTGVLLQVIKLPGRLARRIDATPQQSHSYERNHYTRLHV
jgi:hypothetical protein